MKGKKWLSLALAGMLAVRALAGCAPDACCLLSAAHSAPCQKISFRKSLFVGSACLLRFLLFRQDDVHG